MRIAISGSHSLGKSTVVRDWLNSNPDYLWEDEPYRYSSITDNVIFDLCPVDYLAYSQYTAETGKTDIDSDFVLSMVDAVRESLDHLDILAFVPSSIEWPVLIEEDGIRPLDVEYRDSVDLILKKIYRENLYNLSPVFGNLKLIELIGDQTQRLHQIQEAIESFSS